MDAIDPQSIANMAMAEVFSSVGTGTSENRACKRAAELALAALAAHPVEAEALEEVDRVRIVVGKFKKTEDVTLSELARLIRGGAHIYDIAALARTCNRSGMVSAEKEVG